MRAALRLTCELAFGKRADAQTRLRCAGPVRDTSGARSCCIRPITLDIELKSKRCLVLRYLSRAGVRLCVRTQYALADDSVDA